MSPIEWFEIHSGAVQGVGTIVLITVTVWYAILTRRIAKASLEAQRPYVFVDLAVAGDCFLQLIISNDGDRAAHNISFELTSSCEDRLTAQIRALAPLTEGIQYIAPRRKYRYQICLGIGTDDPFKRASSESVARLDFLLQYEGVGRSYSDQNNIDLAAMRGVLLSSFSDPGEAIASSIHELVQLERGRDSRMSLMASPPEWAGKRCRYCMSRIPEAASKCANCMEWVGPVAPEPVPGLSPTGTDERPEQQNR